MRHTPGKRDELPEHLASHIYYEITPDERRKGYATSALSITKTEAKKIGLKEIIVTCDEDNIASKKVIEANGGEFLEATFIPSIDQAMLRYKIVL